MCTNNWDEVHHNLRWLTESWLRGHIPLEQFGKREEPQRPCELRRWASGAGDRHSRWWRPLVERRWSITDLPWQRSHVPQPRRKRPQRRIQLQLAGTVRDSHFPATTFKSHGNGPSQYQDVKHYSDITIIAMASQITTKSTVCSTEYSGASKKTSKLHVTGSLWGNPLWLVDFPLKEPVTRKMFPCHDVIMIQPLL